MPYYQLFVATQHLVIRFANSEQGRYPLCERDCAIRVGVNVLEQVH